MAGAYPLLFAGGAVALESWVARPALRGVLAALVVLGGVALAPLAIPVLPVRAFARYQGWLGIVPTTGERRTLGALPQIYATCLAGARWPRRSRVLMRSSRLEDRAHAVFFGRNYGEAAAIDVFGAPLGLPPAISAHESYFLWGTARA